MKISSSIGVILARWLILPTIAVAIGVLAWQRLAPFGLLMPPLDNASRVDPRTPLSVATIGLGTRLKRVELRDAEGKLVAEAANQTSFELNSPLAFGTRYILTAIAERPWFGQSEQRETRFSTVAIPQLQDPTQQILGADGKVTLRFDQAVGKLASTGPLSLEITADEAHKTFTLVAKDYAQDQTYPVELQWQTDTGVPLPPLKIEIATPPSFSAHINTAGLDNLGLAMPIRFDFSEPLADREQAGRHIAIHTRDGTEISGKWTWINKHRLQFSPQPEWPAMTAIEVSVDRGGLRSLRGGALEKPLTASFTTGPDRRIQVYLDAQQLRAIENGQVVKTLRISSGKKSTPTVAGSFYIYARFPIKTMRSRAKPGQKGHYVVENVPYAQYFYEDYAFHGAWWHNNFGRPMSHGCVNLSTRKHNRRWPSAIEDAGWLYQWSTLGMPVTVQSKVPAQVAMQSPQG